MNLFKSVIDLQENCHNFVQLAQLRVLFEAQKGQQIFICEMDIESDIFGNYFRATTYPVYKGGSDHFFLAIEEEKKVFGFLWKYTKVSTIGKLKWEFSGNFFTKIVIDFSEPLDKIQDKAEKFAKVLGEYFHCEVVISTP